tara:strand:- start:76 stop:294 length:219 start_codon:yes stop_codon:yes gene_type:complete
MKYKKEINQLLKDLYFQEWMSEEDFEEFKVEYFKQAGITMEKLDEEMKKGVDNGFSVEAQIELTKRSFNVLG